MAYNSVLRGKLKKVVKYLFTQAKTYEYEIAIGICTLLVTYFTIQMIRRRKRNYPPGPVGLPILGYLPFLSENTHLDFIELGKKYGNVFSIKLGSMNAVILHDVEVIKEAFSKAEFLGRPPQSAFSKLSEYSNFFVKPVHIWKEQRRFVFQSMKDLGLGRSKIDGEIQEEISLFLEYLRDRNGEPLDPKEPLSPSMSNNICALVFGKRYEPDDPVRKTLDSSLEVINEGVSQTALASFFPWIRSAPFIKMFFKSEAELTDAFSIILHICRQEIQKHKETLDPAHIRDFIDSYLTEMKSKREKNPETTFSDDALLGNVTDLFGAGSETVRTAITWSIYIIAAYPKVQKRIQKEIEEVIGLERSPEFSDQKQMPYTHAVTLEMMRWKSIIPLNLARYTVADTTAGGYDIPKGTIVLANFWNVHHDPKLWDEPDTFRPERFLNPDGSVLKSSNLIPFSLGKRICPGEAMANMEMFLYFTSILQKFDIVFPEGVKPTFHAKLSLTYRLHPYKVRFIPRTA